MKGKEIKENENKWSKEEGSNVGVEEKKNSKGMRKVN